MSVSQISIFLENRPGTLHEMTNVLDAGNINMRALSLAEADGFGVVRIVVNDVLEAANVLKDAGYICRMIPVVIVAIPDDPGGLNTVLGYFRDGNINLDYMYAMDGGKLSPSSLMVFRVNDVEKAERVLRKHKIRMITQEDIAQE